MQVEFLQQFFASSPAVRLLRSPHAFWIIGFLREQFKQGGQITIPHSKLAAELDSFLDQLQAQTSGLAAAANLSSRDKADTYLNSWSSGSTSWLKRFIDERAEEPSYQLTAEFEKALLFVERVTRRNSFQGTESRLKNLLQLLRDVSDGVSSDRESQLVNLRRQKKAIEQQIAQLESAPSANRLDETQIKERFELAIQQLHELRSEFRAVEDRFKEITRSVQQKILAASESRGDILQFALDSEDMLKQGDQGKSFLEFLRVVHAPNSQDSIKRLIDELNQIDFLADRQEDLSDLKRMIPTLIAEAEKILRTTQHLSQTLRRLLDSRSTQHHQQLASVLREILRSAAERAETPPADVGIDVEVELEVQSPLDRPFWSAVEPFEEVELQVASADQAAQSAALEQLSQLQRLDWSNLRRNIATLTANGATADWHTLLQAHPLSNGSLEILAYLQIAFDDGHPIDTAETVSLNTIVPDVGPRTLRVPAVRFLPGSMRNATASASEASP